MPRSKRTPPLAKKSYLERLQFDPALLNSWVAKYISNIRVVALLVLAIVLLGTISYFQLPKRLNPEVKIPIVIVSTVLPGAGPEDVETLVTEPLEDQVRSLQGLDTVTSMSNENVSVITVQFLSSVKQEDAKNEVQSAVDSVSNLPENAQKPQVKALDFEDTPVWTFAITGEDVPSLMGFSKTLKEKIDALAVVDRVVTSGFEEQEITVTVSAAKIQELGINPLLLAQNLKKGLASYPAGPVQTTENVYAVTIDQSIHTLDDVRNLPLSIQGHSLKLSDVATIEERSKSNQQHAFLATDTNTAKRAVTFYVYKTTGSNIDAAGTKVKELVDKEIANGQGKFTLTTLNNASEEITKQFTDLLGEFRSTIILVFACLFLFLGLRQAIISSFTVPLTFLSAFFFMRFFGMSINFLTMFAFLLSLGLLVDDTIVTVSAMTTYYRTGKFSPLQTGLLVWRDTIVPIWSTTITTIWSFVPLLLTTGIIGEFIKPIPIVVTVTMLSSTAIAVLITLPIMIVILKPYLPNRVKWLLRIIFLLISVAFLIIFLLHNPLLPFVGLVYVILLLVLYRVFPVLRQRLATTIETHPRAQKVLNVVQRYSDHGVIHIEGLAQAYHRAIMRVLNSRSARRKVLASIVIFAVVSFLLVPLGFVQNEFFPKSDQDEFFVQVELPAGTTLANTEQEAVKLLDDLRHTPESEFVTAEVGRGANTGFSGGFTSTPNVMTFSIRLHPKEKRTTSSLTIAENVRKKYQNYEKGKASVVEASGGPPAGADLQIKLLGSDLTELQTYAQKIADHLKTQAGVTNVEISLKPGTGRLTFVPNTDKLSDAGLSVDAVGMWLRLYASGFPLGSVNFDKSSNQKEDVTFKMSNQSGSPEGLAGVPVVSPTGTGYPLLSLGQLVVKSNPTFIARENGNRTISVSATVTQGYSIQQKNKELTEFADSLHLPQGYSWQTGGVNEENQKSVNSIFQAMIVSALLILITMVIQFGSFRQAIIVLIVIPLAVSSVFLIFALTGTPLSFPALIGVLSLFGIVVTNSMFIVDKININKREGMELKEAIADAGASRLEPIILTKLCTVLGLLPITIADPLWRGLGGAIISGLLLSSTIMLLFIPSLYYTWFASEE